MNENPSLGSIISQIRRDILRMVHKVNSGHPGGSLGCTEFFVALYFKIMKHDCAFSMNGKNEDLFFLSNGHISPVYYSTLARCGYFPVKELNTFRLINSRLQGHPTTHEGLPGIRVASGSLGQGLSVAIGAALSKKLNNDPNTVYVLMGDGELQEGQNWEALMFAAAKGVDNIIATRIAKIVCTAIPEVSTCLNFEKPDMHYVRTFRVELPDDFQKAEFLLDHGAIDMIVHRKDLRERVAGLLNKIYNKK